MKTEQAHRWAWIRSREALLAVMLIVVLLISAQLSSHFWEVGNLVNVFQTYIEAAIMTLTMTFIIISGEIDLSVAAMMALCGTVFGVLYQNGTAVPLAALISLGVGVLCGAFNGLCVAYLGLPSLAVTLAGLIGYRGLAFVILEDKSVKGFPDWFTALGQSNIPGLPVPATLVLFLLLFAVCFVALHFSTFGRRVYVVGNNKEAARFAGVNVRRTKWTLFVLSGLMSAVAGLAYAMRIGTIQPDIANGYELNVITMVVLGGVSIFGGSGSLVGVGLSVLVVLSLQNGMSLGSINGSVQTSVIGGLLVLSLLLPNVFHDVRAWWRHRSKLSPTLPAVPPRKEETESKPAAT